MAKYDADLISILDTSFAEREKKFRGTLFTSYFSLFYFGFV